jgi:hypothetical protein
MAAPFASDVVPGGDIIRVLRVRNATHGANPVYNLVVTHLRQAIPDLIYGKCNTSNVQMRDRTSLVFDLLDDPLQPCEPRLFTSKAFMADSHSVLPASSSSVLSIS